MEYLPFEWWFGALIVFGGGIFSIEVFRVRNIFTAATIGFVIVLMTRVMYWGIYAIVPDYIDVIPYLLGYIVLNALYARK